MNVTPFGTMPTGEAVEIFTLKGAGGFAVRVIPYGAAIVSIHAPDREGRLADVVLGFDDLAGYLGAHPYIGVVVGRVAGRSQPRFTLEGRTYELAANDEPSHLHGGVTGWDRRLWKVERADEESVRFRYRSRAGEEGYPGTVDSAVTYRVTEGNKLWMTTEAVTDEATPFCPTQHTYFNLAGEGTIEGHELQVNAETYGPADERMAPLGRREAVEGGSDFRQMRSLGKALPEMFRSHGAFYFLPEAGGALREVARVREPKSGRELTVSTTEACLQVYTGSAMDGTVRGKDGRVYGQFAGLCLECQGYPDGANRPELGDIILRPGRPFKQRTVYAFSAR